MRARASGFNGVGRRVDGEYNYYSGKNLIWFRRAG